MTLTDEEADFLIYVIRDYNIYDYAGRGMGGMSDNEQSFERMPDTLRSLVKLGFLVWREGLPADEHYNDNYRLQLSHKIAEIRDKFV